MQRSETTFYLLKLKTKRYLEIINHVDFLQFPISVFHKNLFNKFEIYKCQFFSVLFRFLVTTLEVELQEEQSLKRMQRGRGLSHNIDKNSWKL